MEVRRVLRILLVITLCDVCQGACVGNRTTGELVFAFRFDVDDDLVMLVIVIMTIIVMMMMKK